ncbi:MAG TPA: mechanosensitive ion channel family protein [Clostridiaceae bacterium]|nr:mechanosensitive ion channel family protein [Clostridiaceae bacterium]
MILNDLISTIGFYVHLEPIILRIIVALLIIVLGFILSQVFAKYIIKLLIKITSRTKSNIDDVLINALGKPAKVLIIGLSFWAAIRIFIIPVMLQGFLSRVLRTFIIAVVFWFIYRAADGIVDMLSNYINKKDQKITPVLNGVFRKSLKFIIIVLEVFMIIKEWGYDISGLIAGLGIGGLAFSLAAKDAASNLLGSITIMTDKTYSIGDYIQTGSVEGIVEEIGFRSTKVRTFENSLISVPNSIMSNEPVTNWSKRGKRRVIFNLDIPLDIPADKINSVIARIKDMLINRDDVNQDFFVVSLNGFGEATLQILIYYFTKTTDYVDYLNVTSEVNLKILEFFEEAGIPIIPPRSMVIQNAQLPGVE